MKISKKFLPYIAIIVTLLLLSALLVYFTQYNPWPELKEKFTIQITNTPREPITNSKVTNNIGNLKIPKINVTAPIITGVDPSNEKEYDQGLQNGVLVLATSGLMGKSGNTVIYGHSSSNENNVYGTIFSKLNNLKNGDEIVITGKDEDYKYQVSEKKVVEANDLSVLDGTKAETLTLITCWPVGSDKQRLIIVAERI